MLPQNCLKGSCKCLCGFACCPVFTGVSLTLGTIMLTRNILCGNCDNQYEQEEREKVCACCGIGTGVAVTAMMMISGFSDITSQHPVRVIPVFEDMER